jgi:nucleoside-diphosphate-sugar epimerase
MVTVALVGATTGLGLTILRHLASSPTNTHKIILLSRSPQPTWAARGVVVREVDYDSHESLTAALSGVHTVLSLIGGSATALRSSQLALVAAAKQAGVKRFAPSEFSLRGGGYDLDLYAGKREVWDAVVSSGMECTRFSCGIFMGFLGTGTPKGVSEVGRGEGARSGEEEALGGLRAWDFVVNVKNGTGDFPGDGRQAVTFTDTKDVARFVEAALGMEIWDEEMGMRGDVMDWRELVDVLEKVQGRKFLTRENEVGEMERVAREVEGKRFYNQVRVALVNGDGVVGDELNQAFPDIKPLGVEEFVRKWWEGVELGEARWEEDRSFM